MKLLLLPAADLRTALPMPAAIAAMRAAYMAVSSGQADVPQGCTWPPPTQAS